MRIAYAAACGLSVVLAAGGSLAAPPPLEDYGKLPAFEFAALSPSGEKVAFITVKGEKRMLLAGPMFEPKVPVGAGDAKIRDVTWADESHVMVEVSNTYNLPFTWRSPRHEFVSALDLNLKDRKMLGVFNNDHSVYPAIMGGYGSAEVDGHTYGYYGAITLSKLGNEMSSYTLSQNWPDLYRVDLDSGQARIVSKGSESTSDWVVNGHGEVAARLIYDARDGQWRVVTGSLGGKVLASGKNAFGNLGLGGLGRTADTVLLIESNDGQSRIQEISLQDGKATELFEGERTTRLIFSHDNLLLGARLDDDGTAVFFDPQMQSRYDIVRKSIGKGVVVRLDSYTDDLRHMIAFTEGGKDSGTFWYVDLTVKKIDAIASPYPSIDDQSVGPTSIVHYTAGDGMALDGVLTVPPGKDAKNLPVVVMPHGGPIGPYDRLRFDWWAQAFASRGYAVFQPNYRGSGGHGAAVRQAGFGQWGRKMQTDISDGLATLARQGVVDPGRACIVGGSYGGYAAMAGITLQHGLYRCAVSYGGVSNLKAMLAAVDTDVGSRNPEMRFWRAAMGADDGNLDALSPDRLADKADAPLLLIAGKDDTVVQPDQSLRMQAAMKRAGKPVELDMLAGEDHWLSREDTRIATLKASVAFVEKYNPAN